MSGGAAGQRYRIEYRLTSSVAMGARFGWLLDSSTGDLKLAGLRVLSLRAIGLDANVFDSITNLPVPEEAYTTK